ncbi:Wide host range VirA protein [Pseudobythopirellula maris]|uniref:histidine kinase n=1 Tax=Pseudobythopirellula maris TaxID=2527991 RepID=A0A5C5ZJ32_9BACT|nr:ATP-binding protein [Pseudobythopirellula maris]TWT87359.1 Wide host range VirA protein [Pseudobythopirellula maris]
MPHGQAASDSSHDLPEPGRVAELERQVQALRAELLEAQKMTALGELVSTTTHEFNNVLTTILNYAKLGLRHTDEPTRTKALEKIYGAGQRAEKITNSVLGMARNRGAEAAPTDLSALVAETLVLLEREMQKYRVQVETSYETERRSMVIANQIQQVLMNLLTNARQAMPRGGRVIIRVAEDPQAGTVDLVVRDTGEGIPTESLPRIFEKFYSTKSGPDETGKGGAGVGLSACREIIEAHGGRLRVESKVGVGTAFTLKLPVAQETVLAPTPKLGLPISAASNATA